MGLAEVISSFKVCSLVSYERDLSLPPDSVMIYSYEPLLKNIISGHVALPESSEVTDKVPGRGSDPVLPLIVKLNLSALENSAGTDVVVPSDDFLSIATWIVGANVAMQLQVFLMMKVSPSF